MSLFTDIGCGSLNKYGEELCGDKVEVSRNSDRGIIVLADGLGSGVKANILSTLTSKIIGTMLSEGSTIDEAVETIASTLPVCSERGIAYSTFSILEIYKSGEGYLVEFDNPPVISLKGGKFIPLNKTTRKVAGKVINESHFTVEPGDAFVMVSDGAIHAGIGQTLNFGWQWDNLMRYAESSWRRDISPRKYSHLILSVCESLYANKPGDDTTVVAVQARPEQKVNVMIGPPVDSKDDSYVVSKLMEGGSKKVVCGGTTAQIVSRVIGKKIDADFNYVNPAIPPTAHIDGIDLTTEGVLTMSKALQYAKKYVSEDSSDDAGIDRDDGASKLEKILLEESTDVHFFVGRAINPAHQNPDFPLNFGIKLKLVEEMALCLKSLGKKVVVEYF